MPPRPQSLCPACRTWHATNACPAFTIPDHYLDFIRRAAWIGDLTHSLDVRRILLLTQTPTKELGPKHDSYISAPAQAAYYKTLTHPPIKVSPGASDHTVSTAFEASYRDTFRTDYLIHTFRTICPTLREPLLTVVNSLPTDLSCVLPYHPFEYTVLRACRLILCGSDETDLDARFE